MNQLTIATLSSAFSLFAFAPWAQAELSGMLESVNKSAETVQQGTQAVQDAQQTVNNAAQMTQEVASTPASALTNQLMSQLGISQAQAEGGAGALFKVAKSKMEAEAFDQLSEAVPGMSSLLAAAPQTNNSLAGGLSAMMGSNSTMGSAMSLLSAFQQLNLSEGMIAQFTPIVMDYVKQQSGPELANLLQLALNGL